MFINTQNKELYEGGNTVVIGLVALAVIGVGFFLISGKDVTKQVALQEVDVAMMEDETQHDDGDVMMEESGDTAAMEESGDAEMMEDAGISREEDRLINGTYEAYAPEKLAMANDGDVVLFFHATWCPSCRAADKAISSASNIPSGLTILKLDYDKETELRKKYKLTTQHSFVQVDSQGNLIKKWIGSASVADVEAKII